MLSVIIPSYKEEKMILQTASTIGGILRKAEIPYELLFIDDGSSDSTWAKINEAAEKDASVRGIHFSRNFGKEAAMFAGLEKCRGDACVVIDCDLQHPALRVAGKAAVNLLLQLAQRQDAGIDDVIRAVAQAL